MKCLDEEEIIQQEVTEGMTEEVSIMDTNDDGEIHDSNEGKI